jgi:PAS domain S-box-containing protein
MTRIRLLFILCALLAIPAGSEATPSARPLGAVTSLPQLVSIHAITLEHVSRTGEGVASLDARVYNAWSAAYEEHSWLYTARVLVIVAAVVGIMLTVMAFSLWLLRRQVAARTYALGESEERYRLLVETSSEGVVVVQDDIVAFANPSACKMLGLDPERPGGTPLESVVDEAEREELLEACRLTAGTDNAPPLAFRSADTGDGIRWLNGQAARLIWNGKPATLLLVSDVTEHRRKEDELEQSHRRFENAFQNSPVAMLLTTLENGTLLEANSVFERMTGFRRDEVIGRSLLDIGIWVSEEERQEFTTAVIAQGRVTDYELVFRRRDGQLRLARVSAQLTTFNQQPSVITAAEDVTEQRLAQAALRASERRYTALFHSAPLGIVIADDAGQIVETNAALQVLLNAGERQLHKTRLDQWVHPDDQDFFRRTFGAVDTLRSEGRHGELRLRRASGETLWGELDAFPRVLVRESGPGVIVFVRDVSDRKRQEAERQRLEEHLRQQQKMEQIGTLAGGVAHDFNNILSVILGYTEIALQDLEPDSHLRPDMMEVHRAAERARDLTQQLLAFSRRQTLEMRVLGLNEVIDDGINMLRRLMGEHIQVHVQLDEHLPPIRGDFSQLQQVLMNLAANSRDAVVDAGDVFITTSSTEVDAGVDTEEVGLIPGAYAVLTFRDTGHGMDATTLARVFEPFYTTKRDGRGTGLGLATVFGIVKQHRGWIKVESRPGLGATFRIYLPVAQGALERYIEEPPLSPAGGTETVLVAEDDEAVRRLVAGILSKGGYTVHAPETPEACVAFVDARKGPLDLLLTDVVMPGMNGRELYKEVAKRLPGLKVLYMSGYAGDVVSEGDDFGRYFIRKPFSAVALLAKVRGILDEDLPEKPLGGVPGSEAHGNTKEDT